MRHPFAWALLLALCLPSIGLGRIQWAKSFSDAKTQAARLGRPIVVFWTHGSTAISGTEQVFAEPGVDKLAARFVWVRLRREDEAAVSAKLGIDAYLHFNFGSKEPAAQGFVFTGSKGKIYGRLPGKPHTGVLRRMLNGVRRAFGPIPGRTTVASLERKLASAKALKKSGKVDYRELVREMIETGYRTDAVAEAKSILGRSSLLELAKAQALNSWRVKLADTRPRASGALPRRPIPKDLHVWRDCKTCRTALRKAMGYIKTQIHQKTGKATWYDGMLGGFSCGFAMMMEGHSERELKTRVIPRAGNHYIPKSRTAFKGYHNWFQAMSAVTLTEYSLRYGLTDTRRKILKQVHQTAVELIDDSGGWFHHPKRGGRNYARDISSIGCLYYAAFLEMDALGMNAEPGLTLARGYLESISDGKTIGYGTPFKRGGAGSGGKDGLVLMGLYGSGRADDPFARSLAGWLADPAHHTPQRGHAFGMIHFMGTAIGLHRMGPAYYDPFAKKWLHALISAQKADGSMPKFPHDTKDDVAGVIQALKKSDNKSWFATGTLASLILMTEPGVFAGLPRKPKRSLPNSEAFEIAEKAFAAKEYAKAYAHYAMVLPPGESLELVPAARAKLRLINRTSREALEALRKRETELSQQFAEDRGSEASVTAYEKLVADYTAFITAYRKFQVQKLAVKRLPPLEQKLWRLKTVWTYSKQKKERAKHKPKAVSKRKPLPEEQATAKLGLAQSYLRSGLKAKAIEILESVVKDHLDTDAAKDARRILANTRPSGRPSDQSGKFRE